MSKPAGKVEHGIGEAVYSNSPTGFHPILRCLCGWSGSHAYNWEEAGADLDDYLKESRLEELKK